MYNTHICVYESMKNQQVGQILYIYIYAFRITALLLYTHGRKHISLTYWHVNCRELSRYFVGHFDWRHSVHIGNTESFIARETRKKTCLDTKLSLCPLVA